MRISFPTQNAIFTEDIFPHHLSGVQKTNRKWNRGIELFNSFNLQSSFYFASPLTIEASICLHSLKYYIAPSCSWHHNMVNSKTQKTAEIPLSQILRPYAKYNMIRPPPFVSKFLTSPSQLGATTFIHLNTNTTTNTNRRVVWPPSRSIYAQRHQ